LKNEGKMMKLNSLKLSLALFCSAFILVGCESNVKEDDAVVVDAPISQDENANENAGANVGEAVETETSGAPEDAQITAQELAAERARQVAIEEQAALREMRTFYFEFDQSTIKSDSRPALAAHAAFLSANPATKVVIQGHCDERGTKGYNIALGEHRANSIAKLLIINGVSKSQIEVVSYGEERPANSAHNEAAWTQNRRAFIEYQ
jgi:peptidoglycan-associated lipoprotein